MSEGDESIKKKFKLWIDEIGPIRTEGSYLYSTSEVLDGYRITIEKENSGEENQDED